jgi:hypothetical protein
MPASAALFRRNELAADKGGPLGPEGPRGPPLGAYVPSVDVLGRLDGDAIGRYVAIIIGYVDGDALARLTLPNELAIRDFGTSPAGCAAGRTAKSKLLRWERQMLIL